MVHEILGIKNHRVDLSNAPGIKKDLQVRHIFHVFPVSCVVIHVLYAFIIIIIFANEAEILL